jgi:hypothetical protein
MFRYNVSDVSVECRRQWYKRYGLAIFPSLSIGKGDGASMYTFHYLS